MAKETSLALPVPIHSASHSTAFFLLTYAIVICWGAQLSIGNSLH